MPAVDARKDVSKNGHNTRSKMKDTTELVAPDGGWGWIVAIASFVAGCLIGTIGVTFSLILEDLLIAMDTNTATASWVPSTQLFLAMLCVPLASAISLRFSFRKTVIAGGLIFFVALFSSSFAKRIEVLILTLGALGGLGNAFVYPPMLYAINVYFDKRRGRITGVLLAGMAFGRFAFALILQMVLEKYGFRATMLIMSAIMLNACVCGAVLQPVKWHMKPAKVQNTELNTAEQPAEKVVNNVENSKESNKFLVDSLPPKEQECVEPTTVVSNFHGSVTVVNLPLPKDISPNNQTFWEKLCTTLRLDFTVLQNPCFFIVCAASVINVCVLPYVFSFLPSLGLTKGYAPLKAATLLSMLALFEIFGRLFTPWIVDFKLLTAKTVLMITSFCFASILWGITLSANYYVDMAICGFGGLLSGGLTSTIMIAIANVLGPQRLPSVMAFTEFIQSFFTLVMGPLLGFARDHTGKFETAFIIMSCIQYCSVLVWLLEPLAKSRSLQPSVDTEQKRFQQCAINEEQMAIIRKVKDSKLVAPDGGWGWMVASASFVAGCLVGAVGVLFSLILEDLLIAMNTTTRTASWVASTQFFLAMLCVPLASAVSLRFSFRKTAISGGLIYFFALFSSSFVKRIEVLILTLGVFRGLGTAFVVPPMLYAVNDYFEKRRGLVTGIFMSGMSIGRFGFALILQVLLEVYAFRGTMLIMSAIMLNVCVCGSILQPVSWHMKPEKDQHREAGNVLNDMANTKERSTESMSPKEESEAVLVTNINSSKTFVNTEKLDNNSQNNMNLWLKFCTAMKLDFTVFQNECFYIVCASNIINVCVLPYVFSFLPSLGLTKGYEPLNAAMLLSIMYLCEIFGRLFTPWILDFKLLTARSVLIIASFCFASLLWGLTLSTDYNVDMVICVFGGVLSGGLTTTNMIAVSNVLGPQKMPSVMAFTQFIQSFFALMMGPLLGMARDYTGNFETAFIIMSCIQYCTIFVWLMEPYAKRRALQVNNKRKKNNNVIY